MQTYGSPSCQSFQSNQHSSLMECGKPIVLSPEGVKPPVRFWRRVCLSNSFAGGQCWSAHGGVWFP